MTTLPSLLRSSMESCDSLANELHADVVGPTCGVSFKRLVGKETGLLASFPPTAWVVDGRGGEASQPS